METEVATSEQGDPEILEPEAPPRNGTLLSRVDSLLDNPANLFNRVSGVLASGARDGAAVVPDRILHRVSPRKGRTPGKTVPITEQVLIGIAARLDGTTEAARAYGVTVTTADGYKDGSRQQGRRDALPNKELKETLDRTLLKAKESAADRIVQALDVIDGPSIQALKGKPLVAAELAVKMTTVVERLTPKDGGGSDNRVQIVVYGPEERDESRYDRLEVPLTMEER